jgi:hypothetical protein
VDNGRLIIDHHRLLVRDVEDGIAVAHRNTRMLELRASLLVLGLPAAPGRVQHHPHLNAALPGSNDTGEQPGVGEHEHLDAQRLLGSRNRVEKRLSGVVG